MIAGNRFDHVIRAQPADHSDAIQVLGANGITVASNVVHQAEECLLIKDDITHGLVLENNVMIGSPSMGNCVQVYDAPGARIVNNTFWQQAAGWPQALIIGTAGAAAPVGTVVRNNIVNRYQLADPSWVSQDHNLIVTGPRVGRHDSTRAPSFAAPGAGQRRHRCRRLGRRADPRSPWAQAARRSRRGERRSGPSAIRRHRRRGALTAQEAQSLSRFVRT